MLPTHRDLDHARADENMFKRDPRRYRRFSFLVLPSPQKGGGWGEWARSSAHQGKRDKSRYEVECVTDVPISYILNR
jgi:hypothetical protein